MVAECGWPGCHDRFGVTEACFVRLDFLPRKRKHKFDRRMKRRFKLVLALLIAVGVIAALLIAYLQMSKEREMEGEAEQAVAAKSRVSPGPNGEAILTLDAETQKRIALRVEPVLPAKMEPELKGYGRVLDPAPLANLVAELDSARNAWAASQKEFERLKLLSEQKNASDRALQAAESTARRDQIQSESLRTQLRLTWGVALAERADLGAFVQSLVSLESVVVRIDLPAGEVVAASPASARIVTANAEGNAISADLLGPAPNTDPQTQGQGFLFLVKANSTRLTPGAAVEGYVRLPGGTLNGFIIPDSAVVRLAGQGWIYLQTSEQTFTRRRISFDHPVENGWFVSEGIAAHARVVVSGAQTLLSEEQKYQIKLLD